MIVTYELEINPQPRKPLTPEQIKQFKRVNPRREDAGAERKLG